jgi:hypothetical protein
MDSSLFTSEVSITIHYPLLSMQLAHAQAREISPASERVVGL